MGYPIQLIDVDRPGETLDVEVERGNGSVLVVLVPNTIVRFELRRRTASGPFEGSVGGRSFCFSPPSPQKRAG